jgi:hypothetical protein
MASAARAGETTHVYVKRFVDADDEAEATPPSPTLSSRP